MKLSLNTRGENMKFKVLDLFCGAGGFSNGIDRHEDFETIIGVDHDAHALHTFEKNFPNATPLLKDLTLSKDKQDIIRLANDLGVNMIIGGPPCQGFSLKGKLKGLDDPRNFLFREYVEIVREVKPEVFVIENVKNLMNALDGYFIEQIREEFEDMGYIVSDGVLNSSHFGVPQNRERAIIIGSFSRSIPLPLGENIEPIVTVKDAISDLAFLESGEGELAQEYPHPAQTDYQQAIRTSDILYNHVATNHSDAALAKLKMIPPEGDKSHLPKELHGKQKFTTTWSRLEWNKVSPTIDTRFDTPSNGRNSHPELHRAITPREAARIQSFPDHFIFYGPKTSVCRQIGNAVPPLMAKAIANQIASIYSEQSECSEEDDRFQLYLADSFSKVREFIQKGEKVNHIITDPPYNISQKNNFDTLNNPRKGVDFGVWDKNFGLLDWIKDYAQLLDKNGSFIIFCSYRFISDIVRELEENDIVVKDILIWRKSNPMPRNIHRRYVQDCEFAVWGVKKGAKWVFNKPEDVPYLRSMFETSTVAGKERTAHPTQKSLKLMEDIIKIHTNEDEIILDPFMGSGTTGVAANNNNRKFIGVEHNPTYYDIAVSRINTIV